MFLLPKEGPSKKGTFGGGRKDNRKNSLELFREAVED